MVFSEELFWEQVLQESFDEMENGKVSRKSPFGSFQLLFHAALLKNTQL